MSSPLAADATSMSSTATQRPSPSLTARADASRSDWLVEYPPQRSLPLDQEALRIYEHAYAIGLMTEAQGAPPVTFSTLAMALLVGQDDTSHWFARMAASNGPDAAAVYAEKRLDEQRVLALTPPPGKPDRVQLSTDKHLLTASARAVLGNAEGWAQRVGGSDIGVRHLVASYVINPPPAHRLQMQSWNYQETSWRPAFFAWIAERYTAEQWSDVSHRPAPMKWIPSSEQPRVKGEAIAFPGDQDTLAVLDIAADFHARRRDPWLRMRTVFHALVESARANAAVRAEIAPIMVAVDADAAQYQRAFDDYFPKDQPGGVPVAFSALDISPRVLNALETARELTIAALQESGGGIQVGVLHLAGALLSRRVDGDEELVAIGLNPQELRLALIDEAHQRAEPGDVWREALGEEETFQAGRPVDLNSDEPEAAVRLDEAWTSDPLAIRRDVETFAALLASKSLEPPLSIGLFGPWGSGKTTFLKRLRRAVERRAHEAKDATAKSESTPYVSNVVHVDFNAWHFAESALTSSLVDTILRALRTFIKDEKDTTGLAWRALKLDELESTTRKVEAAKAVEDAARAAVESAEATVTAARQQAARAMTSLQAASKRTWDAAVAALKGSQAVRQSGVLEAIGDTVDSAEELRNRLESVRARPARLVNDLGIGRTIVFAALVLALPLLVAWITGSVLSRGETTETLASLTAVLSVIAVWLRVASGAVAKVDAAIRRVADEYAEQIASNVTVNQAKAALDAAEARAETAAAELRAAREEMARARAATATASLPAQMLQLVSSRIDADSYSKELTTLSLARADLAALSRILRDQRADLSNGADGANADGANADGAGSASVRARAVDRVILYIDDLDRCKPEDVVRVLQLVHMMLAFELFVVVVAVDARWVEQALARSYLWLADHDGAPGVVGASGGNGGGHADNGVTPQDYLDKIFQIAFWLEPMTAGRAASYLASLVRSPTRESGPVIGADLVPTPAAAGEIPVPTFSKVEIAGIELDYMRALAGFIGSSPRRVKRLVNAYRLIKAGMSDSHLATFLTDRVADDGGIRSGPYQIVIGLLVIGTGAPSSSARILQELAEWDPKDALDGVVEEFRKREHPDWTMAAKVIETLMRTQKAKNVAELRGWARKVGRFLLNRPEVDVWRDASASAAPRPQAQPVS